ncbi:unnamed protein product [Auanema sp. JU1783]|nr:unnamed protein product [Auanema sp. JU1783]
MRLKKNDKYIVLDPPIKLEQNEYSNADYREKVIAACRLYKFMVLRRRDGENSPKPFLNRNLIYQNNTNKITVNKALGIDDPPLVFKFNPNKIRDRRNDNAKRNQLDLHIRSLSSRRVVKKMKNDEDEVEEKRILRDFCDMDAYYSGVERAFKHLNMAPHKEIIVKDGYIVGQNAEITRDQYSDYVSISDFSFQRSPKRCYCHFKFYMNYIFHDGRQVTEEIKNGEFRGVFPIKTAYQIDLPSPKKMRISTREAKLLIKVRTALVQELSEPILEVPSLQEMEMPGFFRGEYFASRTIWTNGSPLQYDYSDFAMNVVHVKNLRPGFIYEERQYDIYSRDLMSFENPAIIGKIARFRTDALSLLVPTKPLHPNIRVRKCTKNCGKVCECGFAEGIISGKCRIAFDSDFITNEERFRKFELAKDPEGDDTLTHIANLLNLSKRMENESSDEEEYATAYQYDTPSKTKAYPKQGSAKSKGKRSTSRNSGIDAGTRNSSSKNSKNPKKGFRNSNNNQSTKNSKSMKLAKGSGVTKRSKTKTKASSKQTKGSNKSKAAKSVRSSELSNKRGASNTPSDTPVSKRLRTETTPLSSLRRSSRFNESGTPDDDDAKSTPTRSRSRQSVKQDVNMEIEDDDESVVDEEEEEGNDELEDEEEEEKYEDKSHNKKTHKDRLYFDLYNFLGKYPTENGRYVNHFRFLQNFYCKSFLLSKNIRNRMRNMFINIPEIFLFYRFVGANSSEPPGTKIYNPVVKYEFRNCHVENLYSDPSPSTFTKLRPMVPHKCIICDRSFETIFSLLMHCNMNYPRLRFSYAVAKTEKLSKSMITQIDVSLNPYYKEGAENRPISIGRGAKQAYPFFVVSPWQTRTIKNNMRMDLTMFVEGISFTDIKVPHRR